MPRFYFPAARKTRVFQQSASGVDVSVIFNTPTAIQTVTLDGARTIGSLSLTNNSTFVWTLSNGTGGSLIFDVSSGNASATIAGSGTATNVLSASVTLNDTTQFTISNTAATSTTGALNMTGSMGGSGGFIKSGAGTMTFNTASKAYTGATSIDQGVLRVSSSAQMTATSAITVASGAQSNLLSGTGAYSFGTSGGAILTLNGTGTSSSFGALVAEGGTGAIATLANAISLASNSSISVVGSSSTLQLNGTIGGTGGLTKTGTGTLTLSNTGTYQGATVISTGTLNAGAANALGGTSGITASSAGTLLLSGSNASTDRINNSASVTINGGGRFNTGGLSEGTRPSSPSGMDGVAGMGALTLQNTTTSLRAVIDFATGANGSSLVFSSLSGGAGAFVNVLNWTGTANSDLGTSTNDRLLFATDPGLTDANLANWAFFNDSGTAFATGGTIIAYGNMFEVVPVPEPSTWAAGLLTVAALGYTQRKRLRKLGSRNADCGTVAG